MWINRRPYFKQIRSGDFALHFRLLNIHESQLAVGEELKKQSRQNKIEDTLCKIKVIFQIDVPNWSPETKIP